VKNGSVVWKVWNKSAVWKIVLGTWFWLANSGPKISLFFGSAAGAFKNSGHILLIVTKNS
jgi:hypothetical protein